MELTFLKTKGIGIDSRIDKKELEWNLELLKGIDPSSVTYTNYRCYMGTLFEIYVSAKSHVDKLVLFAMY